MERTPDPRSAKRGRSEEKDTPMSRQRTSSPDQMFSTPAGPKGNHHHQGEDNDKIDWNISVEEEEQSNLLQKRTKATGANAERTKETETTGDETINLMIEAKLQQRENDNEGTFHGVSQLTTNQPTNQQLTTLIMMMEEGFQKAIKEAIEPLKTEIKRLSTIIEATSNNKPENPTQQPTMNATNPLIWPKTTTTPNLPQTPRISDRDQAFNLARRCIGLFPIYQEDLIQNTENMNDNHDKMGREQQGGAFTVREYLCSVLKMEEPEANKVNIIRTFKQPGNANQNVLYVEFTNELDIKKIRRLANNMGRGGDNDPKLKDYIPKLIQNEYNIVAMMAYKGRTQSPKNSSKIWITNKFELRLRPKGDFTPWNKIPQTNQPLEQRETGAIPKTNPKTTENQHNRPKPNFSDDNNPNYQTLGKEQQQKQSWNGPNLLPDQTKPSNRYLVLGEELTIHP